MLSSIKTSLCSTAVASNFHCATKLLNVFLSVFADILPAERLQSVLQDVTTEKDSTGWEPLWVLRYSLLVKCRGIVKSKGYLLKAAKDAKRRK